jgi:hypothetical protein
MVPWPIHACLVSTAAARAIGGFNEEYSSMPGFPADLDFWCRLAEIGEFFVVKETVCAYRVHLTASSVKNARIVEVWTAYIRYMAECRRQGQPPLPFAQWREQAKLRLGRSYYGRVAYRRAGLAFVNRSYVSAAAFAAMAAICDPHYAMTRFRQQAVSSSS